MGSKTFDGIWFTSYSHDHAPAHVHGQIAGAEVIVELLPGRRVIRSKRKKAVKPLNAKRSDIRRILSAAALHVDELNALWEKTHGSPTE